MMPTPTDQTLSSTTYLGDGVNTTWNFTFAGGYIQRDHVKAYTMSPTGVRSELTVTTGSFIGPYQLSITPAVLNGHKLTIYRDSLNVGVPLTDFVDGSNLTEAALDTLARQAIFIGAENHDQQVTATGSEVTDLLEAAAASAAAAAVSASSASVSVGLASMFAANAADSSDSAGLYKDLTQAAANTVTNIASSLSGSFGFTNNAYDFGFITDTVTYLDLDAGTL